MNLVFKDDDLLKYLRDNNVIKNQTNMKNIALDIDKYVKESVNFRKTKELEPLEGINVLIEKKLINETNYDSSHNPFKSPNAKNNFSSRILGYDNNFNSNDKGKEDKSKTENLSSIFNFSNKQEKIKREYIQDIQPISEEGKSEFLITGMKISNNNTKKEFYDLEKDVSQINELKESKFLPPLTKRSTYFKEKNITIRSQKEKKETEKNESILFYFF